MADVKMTKGYIPGSISRIAELHGIYYHQHWDFKEAIDFYGIKKYQQICLWPFKDLDAARHIYEKNAFKLVNEFTGDQWGTKVEEQQFELILE